MWRMIMVGGIINIVMVLFTTPADAYLDPGSGSMFLQLLLGGLAGVAVALKLYWHRLLVAVGLGDRRQQDESAASSPPSERTTQSIEQPPQHP